MSKVVKFGGSSLASAEQFKKVGAIIRAEEERRFVVPSAPGKRFSKDTKVTDMLYQCYAAAENGENFKEKLEAIKARYQEIIDGLELTLSLEEEFKVIEKNFKPYMLDSIKIFNLNGKMIMSELSAVHRAALKTLKKIMSSKTNPTEMEKLLVDLCDADGDFSSIEEIKPIVEYAQS